MTDQELLDFLKWLRDHWLLASMQTWPNPNLPGSPPMRGLRVESIANQALIDAYRKDHD